MHLLKWKSTSHFPRSMNNSEDEFISLNTGGTNSLSNLELDSESTDDESNVVLEKKQVSLFNIIQMYNSQINLGPRSKSCEEGCRSKLAR